MTLSTHVLDAARGRPATGVPVLWETRDAAAAEWVFTAAGHTDSDGRITPGSWLTAGSGDPAGELPLPVGQHRLVFDTGAWFLVEGLEGFFPEVVVTFAVSDPAQHHHVPLLLSPYAFSTYRGS